MRWSFAVAVVWAALSVLRAAQLVWSAVRATALARRATPVEAGDGLRALLEVRAASGRVLRRAELCLSDEVERPSVFGFLNPRILMPSALMGRLTAEELEQVMVHEMEHLRRRDDWTNLLQKAALVVFPLNPALVWVERRVCAERELACDDSVLRRSRRRKAYAICLTRLAEFAMVRRGMSLVLGAWERQSEVVRRVHRILRRPVAAMSARRPDGGSAGMRRGAGAESAAGELCSARAEDGAGAASARPGGRHRAWRQDAGAEGGDGQGGDAGGIGAESGFAAVEGQRCSAQAEATAGGRAAGVGGDDGVE
jgi:hypothetical protein